MKRLGDVLRQTGARWYACAGCTKERECDCMNIDASGMLLADVDGEKIVFLNLETAAEYYDHWESEHIDELNTVLGWDRDVDSFTEFITVIK